MSTRRQLRDKGLLRGGQEPFARLTWKRDRRFAWLYVDAKARPRRTPSDKQLAAVHKALAARKVCAECGPVDHFVRTTDQLCGDCHAAGVTHTAGGTTGWRTVQHWREAPADDDQADDTTHRIEPDAAAVAADRAAEALARATSRIDLASVAADRDEELARWHSDDEAARLTAAQADTTDDQHWSRDERGVA